ncbi:MAG TPA: Lrp/AsnC family transcriptional regulator [Caulobacteraceae bacterium]|jgi:DNA-binding Lrp family transcriptional regulator|nr:Lrp/AsnC family transcriptional regulator [Caulobacteraceae bacterium]
MPDRQNDSGLDAVDQKLVELLGANARMTLTALAQAVSLSRMAVQGRLARLERDRVIVGYRAVLGETLEHGALGAVLSVVFDQRPCFPVVKKFRDWPEITNYYSVTGPVDAFVVVKVKAASDLADLIDRMSAVEGVGSVQASVMLRPDTN